MKRTATAVTTIVAIGVLAGCSGSGATHQSAQAAATDGSAAGVSQMASGFRNVNYKCIEVGGSFYAVFSTSDGGNNDNVASGVAAVLDPTCHHDGP